MEDLEVCGSADSPDGESRSDPMSELPSVALTRRFLAQCEHHGSQRLAVRLVAVGRRSGVPELPASNDWTAWSAEEMRAAVDYLEQMRIGPESR